MNKRLVVASGGFDPLHRGHVEQLIEARKLGDRLCVIVESDEWVSKKHKVLMPQAERAFIVSNLKCVDCCTCNDDSEGDSSAVLQLLTPAIFAVGPDYFGRLEQLSEYLICVKLGIEIHCLSHLNKIGSSSELLRKWRSSNE